MLTKVVTGKKSDAHDSKESTRFASWHKNYAPLKNRNFIDVYRKIEKCLFTLRSRDCEINQLLMNSWGFLVKLKKNSRLVFSWLIVSTVSWICNGGDKPKNMKKISNKDIIAKGQVQKLILKKPIISPKFKWGKDGKYILTYLLTYP